MNYTLYNDDCLNILSQLPDNSIDMVLCDPPYGTTECSWDSVIPIDEMWTQLKRVIRPFKAIVLFGQEPFSTMLRYHNISDYKYDWIWVKNRPTNFAHAKNQPMKKHELISVFSDGKIAHSNLSLRRMEYNPQGLIDIEEKQVKARTSYDGTVISSRPSHGDFVRNKTGYPNTILEYAKDNDTFHPTQKPIALLEYLIKTYTSENETVLDFTFGSCSTGIACLNTDRNFIGIERDPTYFNKGKEWMDTLNARKINVI